VVEEGGVEEGGVVEGTTALGTEPRRVVGRVSVFALSLNSLTMLGNDMACCGLLSLVLYPSTSNLSQNIFKGERKIIF
jgi:hypothetical protein